MQFMRMVVSLVMIVLTGCSPKLISMDQKARESFDAAQEIKVFYYHPPDLIVPPDPGLMQFGGIGGIAAAFEAQERAQQMVKDYDLKDPIAQVEVNFVSSVTKTLKQNHLNQVADPFHDDDLDELKRQFQNDLILDFKTHAWGILKTPLQGDHYVIYRARGRLVRFPGEHILWQGFCDVKSSDLRPQLTSFEENSGALLKIKLEELAASCGDELIRQFSTQEPPK